VSVLLRKIGGRWPAGSLRRDAQALLAAAGHGGDELSLVLCDDATIRALNLQWRGSDTPTDVLSFPLAAPVLGDVVVSMDTAARQASEQGHPLATELRVLLAHGLCHLLGHDHHEPAETAAMRAEEARLLAALGESTAGLVGRSNGD
jgi:probable rRNA maturation factor